MTTEHQARHREAGDGKVVCAEAEERLVAWINDLRIEGIPVSSAMIPARAVDVSRRYDVPEGKFAASHTNASCVHTSSLFVVIRIKSLSAAHEATAAFAQEIRDDMERHSITRLLNADQTAGFFEHLPKRTIDASGTKTVWVTCGGRDKQRAIAMLLADASGAHFPLFLVLHAKPSSVPETQATSEADILGFGPIVWKEVRRLQEAHNVHIHGNSTAWGNAELMCTFLDLANRTSAPFVLSPPKRSNVVRWVCEAWGRVSARTIKRGLMKCGYIDRDQVNEAADLTVYGVGDPEPASAVA
ncbi:TPA: LOW QUALITY PROTEIN: hypothetical protein N0F65_001079 [Lagenidium giganteum]|uniref:HTH CENPB-type domain-containing protein n=1 Tax=Lagenidium giganteum TaxID=4803 RepID=A0AAV2YNI6_9STRA|nr:TPA: LOW QUALITY PROTEIN: hypothetical protein N0F65_001079 [Lagenidium giganteum]